MAKREQTAVEATIPRGEETGQPLALILTFANGERLRIEPQQLTAALQREAIIHGLKQKLVDAAAISRNPDTGNSATADDKYRAVKKVYDRLLAGEWNATRGAGDGASGTGLLFRALMKFYPGKTAEETRAFITTLDKAKQAAMRANPKIAAIIEELKAADARDGKDSGDDETDALLESFGAATD